MKNTTALGDFIGICFQTDGGFLVIAFRKDGTATCYVHVETLEEARAVRRRWKRNHKEIASGRAKRAAIRDARKRGKK